MPVKLSPRLLTAVGYVRSGCLFMDVGTGHALLPIYLCEHGLLGPGPAGGPWAVASDVREGPVRIARRYVARAGLSDRIRAVRADGLTGLRPDDPADIAVFGMGGERIASILQAAPWTSEGPHRLILQPMTRAARLRGYLAEAGFAVVGETISREGDRLYQTICAEPRPAGAPAPSLTPAEAAAGRLGLHLQEDGQAALYAELLDSLISGETAVRRARAAAGRDVSENDALLESLLRQREAAASARPGGDG